MKKKPLGRLEKVDLEREWQNEATEFTPWLASEEGISLLGDAIGLDDLELEGTEANVGPFRADILCRNTADDTMVLVENQIKRTDHNHLGQLLTYASGLDAVTIVWIAQRFTEEHRAALDWLNRITDDGFHFFGFEIELWRIGNSRLAPKLNTVVKPNDWSKTVKTAARADGYSEGTQRLIDYWISLGEFIQEQGAPFKPPPLNTNAFRGWGLGRTGTGLVVAVNSSETKVFIDVNKQKRPSWYRQIESYKDRIEAAVGVEMEWAEDDTPRLARIRTTHPIGTGQPEKWPEVHAWTLETMSSLAKVYRPIIANLDDDPGELEEDE